jgi:phasin family protein
MLHIPHSQHEVPMKNSTEKLNSDSQANVKAIGGLMTAAYDGFEKIVELNLTVAKALMAESFSHTQALVGAKDPQELMALQADLAQPLAEKSAVYSRHVLAVATDIGSEFKKAFDSRWSEAQAAMNNWVDSVAHNAPVGAEPAIALLKGVMVASENALQAVQTSTSKAAEMVQTNATAFAKKVDEMGGSKAARKH